MCNDPVYQRIKGSLKDYTICRPCNGCLGCRLDNLLLWNARCNSEWVRSRSAFVTFTYDKNHLFYKDEQSLLPSVDPLAIHKYVDNIRHKLKGNNFSYYGCSEYGGTFKRPHYHVLFFGLDFHDFRPFFESTWKNGYIKSLPILRGGVRYVCDYVSERITGDLAIKEFDEKSIFRPYMSCSQGIGSDFFFAHSEEIADTSCIKFGQRVVPVPKYYVNLCRSFSINNMTKIQENLLNKYRIAKEKARKLGFSDYDKYVDYVSHSRESALVSSFRKSGTPVFDLTINKNIYSSSLSSLFLELKNKCLEVS